MAITDLHDLQDMENAAQARESVWHRPPRVRQRIVTVAA